MTTGHWSDFDAFFLNCSPAEYGPEVVDPKMRVEEFVRAVPQEYFLLGLDHHFLHPKSPTDFMVTTDLVAGEVRLDRRATPRLSFKALDSEHRLVGAVSFDSLDAGFIPLAMLKFGLYVAVRQKKHVVLAIEAMGLEELNLKLTWPQSDGERVCRRVTAVRKDGDWVFLSVA
ncbi:hypothetical protein EXIGLDRAFT_774223 [Exidia glandulosa HHB12029]|uniref:Uncharacterized protein n=1 Tax=Exidia glandulosa HHB12029 TaxID=1314781 RepID=A0A165EGJ9_EXIGL|nr:hypothetical protein EXIGLDRAFT_774223 [Exidia glandulosa HHB12029]